MIPNEVHSFSREFAREHGVSAALLAKHLAHKTRASKNLRNGKRWHYNSLKKLSGKLPYLGASTIGDTIKTLQEAEVLEVDNYNRRKNDKTQWFHVPDEFHADLEHDLLRFDANVAAVHGVLPAILHYHLHYFIKLRVRKPTDRPSHVMSPTALSELLPYSDAAIKKALRKLVEAGLIVKSEEGRATYTLPEADFIQLTV